MKIKSIQSRWVLDSRGNPTVEVDVTLASGAFGRASVPSGMSIGGAEARELRDNEPALFGGKGVSKALNIVQHRIAPVLIGMDASHQEAIDARLCMLDGTVNKRRLGANTVLAVSLATAKAAAQQHHLPFYRYIAHLARLKQLSIPMPMVNMINGGAHAPHSTDVQEYMLIPATAHDIQTAIRMSSEIFHELGVVFAHHKQNIAVGDEGGYVLFNGHDNTKAFEYLHQAVTRAGYAWGADITVAIDMAASQLYRGGRYHLKAEHREVGVRGLRDWYANITESYPITSIEDPFDEEAWTDWQLLTKQMGDDTLIVADDLTATNERRVRRAMRHASANAIIIKPNQIGTLTETMHVVFMARQAGWRTILSHRSGETEDTTLAHLAVGLGADFIKVGSVSRGERTAKYNELLRISESLGSGRLS